MGRGRGMEVGGGVLRVSQGQTSAGFTATVAAVASDQTALLTASMGNSSQQFTLTASAPATLVSLSCAPSTLGSNATTSCTVTLNKPPASATTSAEHTS